MTEETRIELEFLQQRDRQNGDALSYAADTITKLRAAHAKEVADLRRKLNEADKEAAEDRRLFLDRSTWEDE